MATINLILWEDFTAKNFYPVAVNHPVFLLRAGAFTFSERAEKFYPDCKLFAICRKELHDKTHAAGISTNLAEIDPRLPTLLLNGKVFLTRKAVHDIASIKGKCVFVANRFPAAVRFAAGEALPQVFTNAATTGGIVGKDALAFLMSNFEQVDIAAPIFNALWEISAENSKLIIEDFATFFRRSVTKFSDEQRCAIYNPTDVFIDNTAQVDAWTTFDARLGPILIESGAKIGTAVFIEGPAVIGKNVWVMPSARIRAGCSIGEHSRVGGELESTVMLGYANKYHDGFLGHSYIGEWVNFGAMTTNSDLKNNYGEIRVHIPGAVVPTGLNKVGTFVGDHAKFGIGTLIPSGSTVGLGVNFFGGGMMPNCLPPFIWGSNDGGFSNYDISKAIDTAKVVMNRRDCELSLSEEKLLAALSAFYAEARLHFMREHTAKINNGRPQ